MPIMSPETTHFVLKTVFPILGVVLANAMAFSPVPTFLHILETGQLHPIDPMPIVIMFGSAIHTFAYAMAIKNPYMYASNGPAVPLVGFSLIALLRAQDIDPLKLRWMLVWVLASVTLVIVNLGIKDIADFNWGPKLQGLTFNFYQYLFFAFPLSQIRTIFVKRDASALVPLLVFAVTINGALWSGYGIAIGNYFIAGPNFIASLVGVAQILCIALFGRKEADSIENGGSCSGSGSSRGRGEFAAGYGRLRTEDIGDDGDDDDEEEERCDVGESPHTESNAVGADCAASEAKSSTNHDQEPRNQKQQQRLDRAAKRQTERRRKSTDLETGA